MEKHPVYFTQGVNLFEQVLASRDIQRKQIRAGIANYRSCCSGILCK
jgi:hypothetical protein